MECPYCNTENRDGVRFCNSCGRPLHPTSTSTATAADSTMISGTSRSLTPGAKVQGGRYVIKKVLGQGGMGAALLATDIRLDSKPVVIKELISDNTDPAKLQEDVRNFKREVITLAHIDHPLVPNVTDHFQEGARYFMVQEYVEGENLEERMDRINQPMKERDALGYASEILDILDYLAQQTPPIVHRDIKPANIIIGTKDHRAHLVDFGIARADETRNAQRKQTSALGTPGYAPPEQYQGNADPRSDLYALGATLHHLLTNRDPRNHPPFSYPPVRTLNPDLSPQIERVLSRAVTNDINQRYQSAAAMKRDIDDILLNRFGVSGTTNSYTLGTSGTMTAISAANSPTMPSQHTPPPPVYINQPLTPLPPVYVNQSPPSSNWQGGANPPAAPFPISQPPKRNNHVVRNLIFLLLILLLIGGGLFAYSYSRTNTSNGIGATRAPDGEMIGISDGSVAFAVNGPGGTYKLQAAAKLQAGDAISAESLWQSAVNADSGDAESLIYLEDQHVLNSHASSNTPYITLVIGTMLTGNNASVGHDDLQGAYVAQKEFNDGAKLSGGTLVRLLIANSGDQTSYTTTVSQQVKQLVSSDHTVVGVMGWPFSSRAQAAVTAVTQAHIPMVSQTASGDSLTGISQYFFRVAPPNKTQAIIGARYSEQVLKAKKVVIFVDPADPYSQSLANFFSSQFTADGNTVLKTEDYTVGSAGHAVLPQLLQDAENQNPDMIYFSGYAADVSIVLTDLPTSGAYANLPIMGGDALYELGYPSSARAGFSHLRFTAFAYPDEWDVQNLSSQKPAFFSEYTATYNTNGQHPGGIYGYSRADSDVILSYDAMLTMLKASNIALATNKNFTGSDLQKALLQIKGTNAVQGVSGQISFAPTGDPVNKAIVVLYVDANGHIHLNSVQGCFLVGKC
ncbi:MAG: ABC transporter substrate-binding protein [Ktedonobacteraceae bacterium]